MKVPPLDIRSSSTWMLATLLGFGSAYGQTGDAAGKSPTGIRQPGSPGASEPAKSPAGALITKEWRVPAGLIPGVRDAMQASPQPTDEVTGRVAAKEWLSSKGIVVEPPASAIFLPSTNRLIVRHTQAQIDLIDALIAREVVAHPTAQAKNPPAPKNEAAATSKKVTVTNDPVIPKIELRDATAAEAFQAITAATGIKVFYAPAPGGPEARITISLTSVPTSEALRYITSLAGLKYTTAKDGVHIDTK